jgi:hypothetical protein
MHLSIAATLFALFVVGFGAVRRLFGRPRAGWMRSTFVEGTIVMVLTSCLSFALALTFNFFATRSQQTFGTLEAGWTVAAVVIAVVGGWLLRQPKQAEPVGIVSGGPAPKPTGTSGESKISRAA